MIESIRIKNFENHVDSTFDFVKGFNLIRGLSNSGKCLTGDTVILTKDGSRRTILDMLKSDNWLVPSLNNKERHIWKKASYIMANGKKSVNLLETSHGFSIKATMNHKFYTSRGWRELKELKKGDWIAVARSLPFFGKRKLPVGHARLLGYLLGDGHLTTSTIGFTNEEKIVLNHFKRLVNKIGKHHCRERASGNATSLYFSKPLNSSNRNLNPSELKEFCVKYGIYGLKHNTKKIPDIIFCCKKDEIVELLKGLLITDGWIHRRKYGGCEVGFCSSSMKMMEQVHHLLLRFGIMSRFREKKSGFVYKGVRKSAISYAVEITGKRFVEKFSEIFGCTFTGKKSKQLNEALSYYKRKNVTCRYDVYPKCSVLLNILSKAIAKTNKTCCELCEEMGLNKQTDIKGNNKANQSMSLPFLEKIASFLNFPALDDLIKSDIFWDKVKINKYVGEELTYDLEVPETHSFFANDIYTHNTSIVRALSLAAYNIFDPRSLRVGAENCEVTVRTDKGEVKVTRGKDNIWEVKPNGRERLSPFKNIGKNILEEAAEVIGFHVVKLGDSEILANISDQLEGHFMMDELEGKKASGSTRAQIIDEISGLTGIETLIKSVSLDNSRNAREIKKLEEASKELQAKKHDEKELHAEQVVLEKAQTLLDSHKKNKEQVLLGEDFILKCKLLDEQNERLQKEHDELLDPKQAEESLNNAKNILESFQSVRRAIQRVQVLDEELQDKENQFNSLPETSSCEKLLSTVEAIFSQISAINELSWGYNRILEGCSDLQRHFEDTEILFEEAIQEEQEILDSIEICPVFLHPISDSCKLAVVRIPVVMKDLIGKGT